ncbi:Mobile element protein CDS [Bradyrhizobium sp.]|nr:Mobile element protein CDS [Bradyrhizobium sp.]
MAVKRTGQPSFVEALMPKGAGANAALDRLAGLVKWYRFEKLIGHLRDEGSPGRPGYPVLVLFRAVLLQSLYGLSERELEEALGDRLSFKRFVGLSLEDATPDHTVLNRFRNQLVEQGLLEKLFGELDRQLENADLHPLRRSDQGDRASSARLNRLQHEAVGHDRRVSCPLRATTTDLRRHCQDQGLLS